MTEETKDAKPVKPARVVVEQNGVVRPNEGTATGNVWAIADRLSAAKGAPAERGEVVTTCIAEGINEATAATQFGRWRKFYGIVTVKKPKLSDEEKKAAAAAKKAKKQAEKDAEKAAKEAEKQAAKDAKEAEKAAKAAAKAEKAAAKAAAAQQPAA